MLQLHQGIVPALIAKLLSTTWHQIVPSICRALAIFFEPGYRARYLGMIDADRLDQVTQDLPHFKHLDDHGYGTNTITGTITPLSRIHGHR